MELFYDIWLWATSQMAQFVIQGFLQKTKQANKTKLRKQTSDHRKTLKTSLNLKLELFSFRQTGCFGGEVERLTQEMERVR